MKNKSHIISRVVEGSIADELVEEMGNPIDCVFVKDEHDTCAGICDRNAYCDDCPLNKAIRKLADYEDAEEQGLLLKLPCKVGDKAYYLHKVGIDEVEVDSFVLNINLFVNVSYYIGCDRFGKTLTPYKTLFFTREEAEKALAALKKGN